MSREYRSSRPSYDKNVGSREARVHSPKLNEQESLKARQDVIDEARGATVEAFLIRSRRDARSVEMTEADLIKMGVEQGAINDVFEATMQGILAVNRTKARLFPDRAAKIPEDKKKRQEYLRGLQATINEHSRNPITV